MMMTRAHGSPHNALRAPSPPRRPHHHITTMSDPKLTSIAVEQEPALNGDAALVPAPATSADVETGLLSPDEKAKIAKASEPPPDDGDDVEGARDRLLTGTAPRSMKQDFYRILEESKGQTTRIGIGAFFLLLTAVWQGL